MNPVTHPALLPPSEDAPLAGCLPAFNRHRGYPPRFGWLRQVHHEVRRDPQLFTDPGRAAVTLAVGHEGARSKRFWSRAFGMTAERHHNQRPSGRLTATGATPRGHWLLDDDGADPYLEDPASLWLLHWWLVSDTARCHVPTWRYLFCHTGTAAQRRHEVRAGVQHAARARGWTQPTDAAVNRDLACILAMYAPAGAAGDLFDDAVHPFRQLGLITRASAEPEPEPEGDPFIAAGTARFAAGIARHDFEADRNAGALAPPQILAYTCLRHAHLRTPHARSIALATLATAPDGPGRVMRAERGTLRRALHHLERTRPELGVALTEGQGDDVLTYASEPGALADLILARHYDRPAGPDTRPSTIQEQQP
ncbi:MAG: DUF4007 family protein [Streptomycetaceae bacterium]|nr:DUF4007 family protein [Streptomycetaceae bacterium]